MGQHVKKIAPLVSHRTVKNKNLFSNPTVKSEHFVMFHLKSAILHTPSGVPVLAQFKLRL